MWLSRRPRRHGTERRLFAASRCPQVLTRDRSSPVAVRRCPEPPQSPPAPWAAHGCKLSAVLWKGNVVEGDARHGGVTPILPGGLAKAAIQGRVCDGPVGPSKIVLSVRDLSGGHDCDRS